MQGPTERSVSEIDPFVRLALEVTLTRQDNGMRVCYDHRLFCLRAGSCMLDVGDVRLRPTPGDLLLIRSGTPYRFHPEEEGISLIVVNFDFFGASDRIPKREIPIPPYSAYRSEGLIEAFSFSEGVLSEGYAHIRMDSPPRELLSLILEAERGELFCTEEMNAYLKLNASISPSLR